MVAMVLSVTETFTVPELCLAVSQIFEDRFSEEVWITGSISGLSRSARGHAYFNLVEPDQPSGAATSSVLPVALFAGARHRVNSILKRTKAIRMADGVQIKVKGRIAFYPPQSRVQLIMSEIDPTYTVAQMVEAKQLLIETLSAEGVLKANQALKFPVLPLTVGLITSVGSAAHADFTHHIETSGYPFDLHTYDVRVQGKDAHRDIASAIEMAQTNSRLDVLVVVRGGGARSDLVAFDHEDVARSITRCRLPVIAGVGHEIDRSVVDEVSHLSTKTPTAAAGALIDAVGRVDRYLDTAARRLAGMASQQVEGYQRLLDQRVGRLSSGADSQLALCHQVLSNNANRLESRALRSIELAASALEQTELKLGGHNPAVMLEKGWTMTLRSDGTLIRSVTDVAAEDTLFTTLVDGTVESIVVRTRGQ